MASFQLAQPHGEHEPTIAIIFQAHSYSYSYGLHNSYRLTSYMGECDTISYIALR